MKILQINNILYSFGGAEKYLFRLSHLLKSKGHRVAYFSIDYPQNINTKWKKYFPKYIDYEHIGLKNIHKILQGTIYSFEAKIKINKLLNDFQPDVVHLHSIYKYISPSILSEIKKRRIPIIQTVHDYHLLAPSRTLFHDGKICEVTKIYRYYNALLHKCIKKSYIASLISVLSFYIHSILGLYTKNVDYFITPSHFMENNYLSSIFYSFL